VTTITDKEYDLMLAHLEQLKTEVQSLLLENHVLESLCIQAADALDDWHAGLKAELRKAAE